jgi:hypothetical protein
MSHCRSNPALFSLPSIYAIICSEPFWKVKKCLKLTELSQGDTYFETEYFCKEFLYFKALIPCIFFSLILIHIRMYLNLHRRGEEKNMTYNQMTRERPY